MRQRPEVVQQYEQACAMAGVHAGLVDLATFSVINGILAAASSPAGDPSAGAGSPRALSTGDWLLVHVTDSYLTLAVIRDGSLLFFRNRSEEEEGTLADLIHQTAMYYEDRLKGTGFSRVLLVANAVPGVEDARRRLEQRLEVATDLVPQPETAALAGILMRERKAA